MGNMPEADGLVTSRAQSAPDSRNGSLRRGSAVQRFLDRMHNDRWLETEPGTCDNVHDDLLYRRAFNDGSRHVEQLFHRWINEERLEACLGELRDAPAQDLTSVTGLSEGRYARP